MKRISMVIIGLVLLSFVFVYVTQAAVPSSGAITKTGGVCVGRSVAGDRDVTVQWTGGQPSPYTIYADEGTSPNLDMVGMLVCSDGRYVNWTWAAADNAPVFTWGQQQPGK